MTAPDGPMAPFREQLLEVLRASHVALNANEIAQRVGVPATQVAIRGLHYHMIRMEEAGLVEVKRSGKGRGNHNLYRAVNMSDGAQ